MGPADTGLDNGRLIDAYDVVVRLNFTSSSDIEGYEKSHGTKTHVSYFNNPVFKKLGSSQLLATLMSESIFPVLRGEGSLLKTDINNNHELNEIRTMHVTPITFSSRYSYHGIQRVALDLLSFEPAELALFNMDFFTGVAGGESNRIKSYRTAGSDLGYTHDPLQGLRLIRYLHKCGLVVIDEVIEQVLQWSDEQYIHHIENLEKNNPSFLKIINKV